MQSSATLRCSTKPFFQSRHDNGIVRRSVVVHCSSGADQPARRGMLAGLAGILASPFLIADHAQAKLVEKVIPKSALSNFQRADLLKDFQDRAATELKKVLTVDDAPTAMRLLLHDAATYDAVARTGGVNGSIVLAEELNRPENKDLKGLVDRLSKARDALAASGPSSQKKLSWADTIVLAVKYTQEMAWRDIVIQKNPKNGAYLADNFSNPIAVKLGRLDATEPDAAGRFPPPGAPARDVLGFMGKLGVKNPSELEGPFGRRAPFWERVTFVLWPAAQPDPAAAEVALVEGAPEAFAQYKQKYDKSRSTTFRQDYEIDFGDFLNRLADLGAKFDRDAYLYDITVKAPDQL